ncbi:hypothetical protein AGMMS50239_33960 [Bacteroidia bacterium]|nr:hypothetical protein AGMMS50239_33960 [Bacteroidia bacterium]
MKVLKYISIVLCCLTMAGCEIDNYDGPDATIQGKILDHLGKPFEANQGAEIIRMREISWAKDETSYIGSQLLRVQQDGTYRHTKWFSGAYRMLPYAGAFFPYDDEKQDGDDAGELVEISGTTTRDFTVTPYLTIEWVKKPYVTSDNFIECSVKFTRNQKAGYDMPDVREANLHIGRTVNPVGSRDGDLVNSPIIADANLPNSMEGQELVMRTKRAVKYTGTDYYVRVAINCKTVSGNNATNYPGMGADNYSTVEKIHVP